MTFQTPGIIGPDGERSWLKPQFKEKYLKEIRRRQAEERKKYQPTRHQQDAVDTARLLNDMPYLPRYLRLFKKYRTGPERDKLLKCRDWILSRQFTKPGAAFLKTYKTFLADKPYKPPTKQ